MKLSSALCSLLLAPINFVNAEGLCPPGYYQTTPPAGQGPVGCAPIPIKNAPKIIWDDRWGALSSDGKGNWGIVTNMPSRSSAEANAVEECKKRGGDKCMLRLAYVNQCAAIVADGKNIFTSRAETEKQAIDLSEKMCAKENNPNDCWIYYSGCSHPVRRAQ